MNAFATLLASGASVLPLRSIDLQESTPRETRLLDSFLAGVEAKAFRIAQIALRHEDDALDAVQDAMLRLVRNYSHRPAAEWKPLFYRILENCIRDVQRRRMMLGRLMGWCQRLVGGDSDADGADPLERVPDPAPTPAAQADIDETLQALELALAALPPRQRQAFLLRNFAGLDVATTARAMACSEGSVKTHYSRALHGLRIRLEEFRP